jgi:5-methylcytosine-specific restriction protein A
MPVCCDVMRAAIASDVGDRVLQEPPSGQGASLTIRYVLPRPA